MSYIPPNQAYGPTINRIADVMEHINRYAFHGVKNLALDARVSRSTVSRLISNKLNPSFALVARITGAIEQKLGYRIDPRDLIAENGQFLTRFACDLVRCPGCLPSSALDEFGGRQAAFTKIEKGHWVSSRYPTGFPVRGGQDE